MTVCSSCRGPLSVDGVCVACAFEMALSPQIGPYRLLEPIGRGGMGEVWLAEQTEPVRRRVALKLIKAGMDTDHVIARFEAERQALALMSHPNVARVLDAGTTEDGKPYFVMEYVDGLPITEHCVQQGLTTAARVALFLQVCDAVQHAHRRTILHRDLKPSNVLVAVEDGTAVPKVIDFGVAKAMAQPLTERTLETEVGTLLGTPEYMSPEQANLGGQDLDTRTDVYGLGVLLYEILTDSLPFDPEAFRLVGLDEMRRLIREVEPPRPSQRRPLAPELDWITMKALEKDRERRYGSVAELGADLRRHLDHEPVLAGPPSRAYRARKFVRRHRVGVAVASVAAVSIAVFATVLAVQTARTAREAEAKKRVAGFLTELFAVSNPTKARGSSVTARELLDRGVSEVRRSLQDDPRVRADLLATMGAAYESLGLYGEAEPLLRDALETRRRELGEDHPDTLRAAVALGRALHGALKDEEAERVIAPALERQQHVLGPENLETLQTMGELGRAYWGEGRQQEAEALFRQALPLEQRVLGPDHPETLRTMHGLGLTLQTQDRLKEAQAIFEDTLARRRRVLGPEHPYTLNTIMHLAINYGGQGRKPEREALQKQLLEIGERVLGPRHMDMVYARANMAMWVAEDGRPEEALDHLRRSVTNGLAEPAWIRETAAFAPLLGRSELQELVRIAEENQKALTAPRT